MSDDFRSTELVGSSAESFEAAVQEAVHRAARTIDGIRWAEVLDQRARVEGTRVAGYEVTVRIWYAAGAGDGDEARQ